MTEEVELEVAAIGQDPFTVLMGIDRTVTVNCWVYLAKNNITIMEEEVLEVVHGSGYGSHGHGEWVHQGHIDHHHNVEIGIGGGSHGSGSFHGSGSHDEGAYGDNQTTKNKTTLAEVVLEVAASHETGTHHGSGSEGSVSYHVQNAGSKKSNNGPKYRGRDDNQEIKKYNDGRLFTKLFIKVKQQYRYLLGFIPTSCERSFLFTS